MSVIENRPALLSSMRSVRPKYRPIETPARCRGVTASFLTISVNFVHGPQWAGLEAVALFLVVEVQAMHIGQEA
jgi:hypothetical protein